MNIQFPPPVPSPLALRLIQSPCPQAGFPSPATDYLETTLDLHEYLVRNPVATFYLRVEGDSMIDALIYEGDVLVVDRSVKATRGRIVVASLSGGDRLLVKRLGLFDKRPVLLSCNAQRAYPPIFLDDDVSAEIWGVVIGTVRKF